MNKLFCSIASTAFIALSLCMFSCEESEEFDFTKLNGLPSIIKSNDFILYLSYSEKQLSKMKVKDGSTAQFNYEQGEIKSVSYLPPEGVADGHAWIQFERTENNKIQVSRGGEPDGSRSKMEEIELDENLFPVKISDLGFFEQGADGLKKIEEGETYTLLTYDPSTKNLIKREIFSLKDSLLQQTYTYKYDMAHGLMDQVKLPLWFAGYWNNIHATNRLHYRLFFNYTNNLTEETIENKTDNSTHTIRYEYTYNNNDYPAAVSWSDEGEGVVIRY